jgi:hypothetical protein
MEFQSRRAAVITAACLTFLLIVFSAAAQAPARIVAVADVHGAFEELVSVLQRTGLIDGDRRWVGGPTTLVQTGDVVDRGRRTRECLDLLMNLERQADKVGGSLIPLFGNHEIMNIMSDLRYVTPEIYGTFATDKSEKVREAAYQGYLKFNAAHRGHAHPSVFPDSEEGRAKWMKAHPPGYFEYVDAMGPDGVYGRWLRKHRAVVKVGDGLFVHGGLNPNLKFRSVADLDDQVRSEISDFDTIWRTLVDAKVIWRYMTLTEAVQYCGDEAKRIQEAGQAYEPSAVLAMRQLLGYGNWACCSPDGPLWYRGLAQGPEEQLMGGVMAMLARLKARFIVEGHTVASKSDITQRFENHVFLIDTGMNRETYEGRPSALEIRDGKFTAYYADGEPRSLAAPASLKNSHMPGPRQ